MAVRQGEGGMRSVFREMRMKAVDRHKVTQGLPHQFNCGYYLQWKAGS